jgi:integrase
MKLKLTEKVIESLPAPSDAAQAYYWDTEDTGFGLVVGRTGAKTFVASGRVDGRKVKVTIGAASPGPWNVVRARRRAKELLGDLARGLNPNKKAEDKRPAGITLREALALHLAEMRDVNRREISIETMEYDVSRLLAEDLDRPLADLTVEAVQKIKERGREHRTQTNRLLAHLSAIWNTARRLRRSTFTAENPVGRLGVGKYALAGEHAPEQPRVNDADLPEWYRRVQVLSPIRRDLQMLTLFTGLRDANASRLRLDIIDWDRGGFVIPMSKTTPFTIPFSSTVREILEGRRDENKMVFAEKGDQGWVFPTTDTHGGVIATVESKERRPDKLAPPWLKHGPAPAPYPPSGRLVLFLPGLHALRRTYLSVADDIGVPDHVQKLLSNHSFGGRDVHEKYLRSEWSRLVAWVEQIDHALWERIGDRQHRSAVHCSVSRGHTSRREGMTEETTIPTPRP